MSDHRCPNCENDLTDAVMAAIVTSLRAGGSGVEAVTCPHCDEALSVTVTVNATLARQPETVAAY